MPMGQKMAGQPAVTILVTLGEGAASEGDFSMQV